MTLIGFLRERLDEDEAMAEAAGSAPWVTGVMPRAVHVDSKARAECRAFRDQGYIASADHSEICEHIVRHHPARVLAEVEAKRVILREHGWGEGVCERCTTEWQTFKAPCPTVRALTAVYADHPDYRKEWTP